jgi:signal transduction histidine kinase
MQERISATETDQALVLIEPGTSAILQASRRARDVLGYSDAEIRAMSFADIFMHPSGGDLEGLLTTLAGGSGTETARAALLRTRSGRAIAAEFLLVRLETRDSPLLAAILHFAGLPVGSMGGPRLEPGNATFVDFASRLGHDLNNLLSTVIGSLGLIREDGLGSLGDETHQLVDDALSASRECADLLDRLMAAAGKQLLRPQRVAANSIIERLTPLLAQTLPDDIDLQVSLNPELPDVDVDPDRLEAAIIGLVVNAREAMPSGGELSISSDVGKPSGAGSMLESDRHYVQITVSDAGPGIPEDLLDRVLEPLFTTKSSGTGRGLGLSIINGFVQQSHGALSLDSASERGTRVTLNFPPAE